MVLLLFCHFLGLFTLYSKWLKFKRQQFMFLTTVGLLVSKVYQWKLNSVSFAGFSERIQNPPTPSKHRTVWYRQFVNTVLEVCCDKRKISIYIVWSPLSRPIKTVNNVRKCKKRRTQQSLNCVPCTSRQLGLTKSTVEKGIRQTLYVIWTIQIANTISKAKIWGDFAMP